MMTAKIYKGDKVAVSTEQEYETLVNSNHDDLMRADCVSRFINRVAWIVSDKTREGEVFTKVEITL